MVIAFIHMPGPQFFLLYCVVSGLALAGCWFWVRSQDPTLNLPVPPLPKKPDPFKIAFLRGGENEVTRVAILALLDRGYLRMTRGYTSKKQIRRVHEAPDDGHLSELGRTVFNFFASPRDAREIFASLPASVAIHCEKTRKQYEDKQLLNPPDAPNPGLVAGLLGGVIILGFWLVKLFSALSDGRSSVLFLNLLGVGFLVLLLGICRRRRRTRLGERYLDQIRDQYQWLGDNPADSGLMLLLAMGIFGVQVLSETPYFEFKTVFPQASAGGGGCGGGCGGGDGGGDGGDGGGDGG